MIPTEEGCRRVYVDAICSFSALDKFGSAISLPDPASFQSRMKLRTLLVVLALLFD